MNNLHRLLQRQLKRFFPDWKSYPKELRNLLEAVNEAYIQSDLDRNLLERSLDLSSQELIKANSELRAMFQALPDMFFHLDSNGTLLSFTMENKPDLYPPVSLYLGKNIDEISDASIKTILLQAVKDVKNSKSLVNVEFEWKAGNHIHYYEARLLPLLEDQIVGIVRNITDAKVAREELKQSEERYRSVLEASPDSIIVYDVKGRATYVNPAFTRVFGWNLEEINNLKDKLIVEEFIKLTVEKRERLYTGQPFSGFETRLYSKNEKILDVVMSAAVRYNNAKKPIGAVLTLVDITLRKVLEAELRVAKEAAESANLAKSEFLANMSHELRTPMHAILGFSNISIERIDSIKREKLLDNLNEISSSGQRLLLLLNDLLDLSKLETAKIDYVFKKKSLSDIISIVIKEFSTVSEKKEIQVKFHRPEFDDNVMIEEQKIMQVFRNLLSNAIKFSEPKNSVKIEITKQSGAIEISIMDSGVGIPEEELETIFDKFVQSSKTNTGAGGTGLGLAICNEITRIHNGKIWAKNNKKGGATFFLSLPRNDS